MTFSPDGKLLASVGNDNTVIIWDVASGQELRTFGGHNTAITAVAFSPNGKLLATASSAEGLINIWNIETAPKLWTTGVQEFVNFFDFDTGQDLKTISLEGGGNYIESVSIELSSENKC